MGAVAANEGVALGLLDSVQDACVLVRNVEAARQEGHTLVIA